MSALADEAEEDADTPAQDHWSLLSQGAEARVYGLDLCGLPAVAKHRHRTVSYTHLTLPTNHPV